MSLTRRADGCYIARWYENGRSGKRLQKNLGAITYKKALEQFKKLAAAEPKLKASPEITFAKVAKDYLHLQGARMKPKSLARATSIIENGLIPAFGDQPFSSVDASHVETYMLARIEKDGVSKATVNREWNVIRAIVNFAKGPKKRLASRIERGDVKAYKLENRGVKDAYLQPEEWRAFIATFDDEKRFHEHIEATQTLGPQVGNVIAFGGKVRRFGGGRKAWSPDSKRRFSDFQRSKGVFIALLFTGARLNEILNLRWRQIDLRRGQVQIEQEKSSKTIALPIADELRAVLEALPRGTGEAFVFTDRRGRPYYSQQAERLFALARTIAGIRADLSPHALRHSFGSWAVAEGVPLKIVQELLGHSDIAITAKHYAHLQPTGTRDAMNRISEVARSGQWSDAKTKSVDAPVDAAGEGRKAK